MPPKKGVVNYDNRTRTRKTSRKRQAEGGGGGNCEKDKDCKGYKCLKTSPQARLGRCQC